MDSTAGYTKINSASTKKGQKVLQAARDSQELTIEYVSTSGRKSQRTIAPKALLKKNGNLYVHAFCKKADALRIFKLETLTVMETFSFSTDKDRQNDAERAVSEGDSRPSCITSGCDNLAEIRVRQEGKTLYRKQCTSCRKGVVSGPQRKGPKSSSNSDRGKPEPKQPVTELTGSPAFGCEPFTTPIEDSSMVRDSYDGEFMSTSVDQLRTKLLDFSRRNNLINFTQNDRTRRVLRVVDEVPAILLDKLVNGGMQFKPLPDIGEEPEDEKTEQFKVSLAAAQVVDAEYISATSALAGSAEDEEKATEALSALKDRVRAELKLPIVKRGNQINIRSHALSHGFEPDFELPRVEKDSSHKDNNIQTLLMPDDLEKRLKSIYGNYNDVINDKGLNVFYACFGFLKWVEHSNSDQQNISPLILLPIEIDRKKSGQGHKYTFAANGSEPVINRTLKEKLYLDLGVSLPEFLPEIGDEEQDRDGNELNPSRLEQFFDDVNSAIESKDGWSLARWVSFGFFNYQDIVIFNDLQPENWPGAHSLFGHDLVARLLGGLPANEVSSIDESRDIDGLTISKEIPHLVLPADSSQHSAIIHALEGKPLVVQGPPGTGKSQTITNLIAALVANGKRVLFLAEKQPALNVVKDRLVDVGLADLIFDPKVTGNKSEVYDSLRRRRDARPKFDAVSAEKEADKLITLIEDSADYKGVINAKTGYCNKSLYELIWLTERARNAVAGLELPFYLNDAVNEITEDQLVDVCKLIDQFLQMLQDLPDDAVDLSDFYKLSVNPLELEVLQEQAKKISQSIKKAEVCAVDLGIGEQKSISQHFTLLNEIIFTLNSFAPETLAFVTSCENAEEQVANALSAFDEATNLKINHPFLNSVGKLDQAVAELAAKELDDVLVSDPVLGSYSIETLMKMVEQNDALRKNVEKFLHPLVQHSGLSKALPFGELEKIQRALVVHDFDSWKTLFSDVKRDAISENTAEKFDAFVQQITSVRTDISNLPETVDFSRVFVTYGVAELEALKASFDSIGFINGFGATAKKTKAKLASIGIPPDSGKELVNAWLDRLIKCCMLAKALDNHPDIASIFASKRENIFNSRDEFWRYGNAIRDLLKIRGQNKNEDIRNADLNIFGEIGLAFAGASKILQDLGDLFGDKLASIAIGDLPEKISATTAGMLVLIEQAKKLDLQKDIALQEFCADADFNTLILGYFNSITKGSISALGSVSLDTLEDAQECVAKVKQIISEEDELITPSLASLLCKERLADLMTVRDRFVSIEKALQMFGENFANRRFAEFDVSGSERKLSDEAAFLDALANADTDVLTRSAVSFAVERQILESFDPAFFGLLREMISANGLIDEDVAKQFFVLRVGQAVLRDHFNKFSGDLQPNISNALGRSGDAFKHLDLKLSQYAADLAFMNACNSPVPKGVDHGSVKNWSEKSLIYRELNKERRHLSIRQLVKRASSALLGMKPVWFLNPIGVSQFLPRQSGLFDVVIIDEASQMLPEKAIPSIARAKNAVIVGDNKQMPPTNWMKASIEFGEEDEEEVDAESILDLAQQRVGNSVSLRWHYRSRHPDLIRFSNLNFYDNKLEIFPTPTAGKTTLGVRGIKVDGVYKGQVNQIELEEVMIQARELMERYPDESLGIVAINRPQMELIKQALEASADPIIRDFIERWDSDPLNTLFVKNLDNVQGDERDNIIISTVYGRDENGHLFQRFPSVVSKNGHRRLNVLITRAKNRVILITSLNANDVKLTENSPQGKRVFRDYIEYSMTGKLDTGVDLRRDADSDFEIAVGQLLKDAGYSVTPQVGVRGFRIDLGVSHELFPHGYIAGIECDGAAFHSSASARDRDAVRQQILEGLGWKIYRVWSTDWFSSPERERAKLLRWLSSVWSPAEAIENREVDVEEGVATITDPAIKSGPDVTKERDPELFNAGPSGVRGLINIEGAEVEYWKPFDGLYELWIDNKLIGFTEEEKIEVANANTGFANRMITQHVTYNSELRVPTKLCENHDRFEIGLRWIYRQYLQRN